MIDTEFDKMVKGTVSELGESYGMPEDKAFIVFCATQILTIDEEFAVDSVLMGGPGDLGLDLGHIDERDREITLIQGKYTPSELTRDIIRGFAALPQVLADHKRVREAEANARVRDFSREYRRVVKKGYTLNSCLFHWGQLSSALRAELDGIKYYGLTEIKTAYEETQSIMLAKKPDRIDLELSIFDQYLQLYDRPGAPRCLVGAISLRTLWNLYHEHKSGLLDDNIRLHAGDKTAANKSMHDTLVENGGSDSRNFIFYNNGITILCDAFKSKKEKGKPSGKKSKLMLTLERPQIINGAQTTYTVGRLCEEDLDESVGVIVRILCPPKKNPEDFKEKVIRCNNTQTPVTSRDFRSNDDIQKKLFDALAKWSPPYFYQRKLGLWEALPPKDQAKFRKVKGSAKSNFRIIDNRLMAQCILAWEGQPAAAKNAKRLIFVLKSDNGIYEDVFPENCYEPECCKYYVVAYELNNLFVIKRKEWSKSLKEKIEQADEGSVTKLESDRFVTHFNFFAIASIGYIFNKYLCLPKPIDCTALLEEKYFDRIFKFLKSIFGTQLRASERAAKKTNSLFNINNWFKIDLNFHEVIKPAVDERNEDIPRLQ